MPRCLGKLNAQPDHRLAALRAVAPIQKLAVPATTNWRADVPDGIAFLGNDIAGCCVWASMAHYVQLAGRYTGRVITPTQAEVLGANGYGSTGFNAADGSNDNGTIIAGQGGALEFWTNNGIDCGGERNHLTSTVTVDATNLDELVQALSLGPVLAGAVLRQADVASDYLWVATDTDVAGGHTFLIVGHTTLSSGKRYYDVETWDGLWRASDDWLAQSLDEAYSLLDPTFFGPSGLDPADLDQAAYTSAQEALKA